MTAAVVVLRGTEQTWCSLRHGAPGIQGHPDDFEYCPPDEWACVAKRIVAVPLYDLQKEPPPKYPTTAAVAIDSIICCQKVGYICGAECIAGDYIDCLVF